ncbi:MAG: monovalent cation/H(+) antiporter subunit G [Candidatus Omnitrophota bacterium]
MNEIISLVFILVGITFDLFGTIGLIRLPDVYNRLQASTKCVTLGTCGILLGVVIKFGFTAAGVKAILCIIFLLLTSPVAAHALARGAHRAGVQLWEKSVCDKYQDEIS